VSFRRPSIRKTNRRVLTSTCKGWIRPNRIGLKKKD